MLSIVIELYIDKTFRVCEHKFISFYTEFSLQENDASLDANTGKSCRQIMVFLTIFIKLVPFVQSAKLFCLQCQFFSFLQTYQLKALVVPILVFSVVNVRGLFANEC